MSSINYRGGTARSLGAPCQVKGHAAHFSPGSVLRLLNGSDVGKLVRAVSVEVEADARRLVMSFDMDPTWHRPFVGKFQGNRHAYHIIRFGHRLRMLLPPETPCEHWGSQLHILHRDMQTVSASRHAVRLFLKAAELECARDEAVVAALAEFHVGELQRDPQKKLPGGQSRRRIFRGKRRSTRSSTRLS